MPNKESQNIEWKESWRDEYLKWICGFANSEGGKLYIGKNDGGEVVGIDNASKLLEDIPNKVRNSLGILILVNLNEEDGQEYLEVIVDKYPYPISYKGTYHVRSGATKQELRGIALDKFLLQKQGKKWDGVPIPHVGTQDLHKESLVLFRKRALKSGRLQEDDLSEEDDLLLDRLHLKEGDYLKRATILLFHPDPEQFVTGAFIKIGFFESDEDLRYQDEVHGSLLMQIEKALDLLQTKYLRAYIHYEGVSRVERYPFPISAIREALLNAVAHKDYSSGLPIQISVYKHKIIFWNEAELPENWTVERLKSKHPSKPFNPDIANTLFRSGYIEAWGRGTIKMMKDCEKHGIPSPEYRYLPPDFEVEIYRYTKAWLEELGIKEALHPIVLYIQENGHITNTETQQLCGVSKRTATRYLSELEEWNLLKRNGKTGNGVSYVLK